MNNYAKGKFRFELLQIGDKIMQMTSQWIRNFQSTCDNGHTAAVIMDFSLIKDGGDIVTITLKFALMALVGCVSTTFAVVAKSKSNNFNQ